VGLRWFYQTPRGEGGGVSLVSFFNEGQKIENKGFLSESRKGRGGEGRAYYSRDIGWGLEKSSKT